jgi:hypothetical protein
MNSQVNAAKPPHNAGWRDKRRQQRVPAVPWACIDAV